MKWLSTRQSQCRGLLVSGISRYLNDCTAYIRMPYMPADARCEKFSFLCKQHHSSTNRRSPVLFCVQPLNQKIKKNIMRKLGKISQIARISCSTSGAKGIDPQEFLPSTTTIQTCMYGQAGLLHTTTGAGDQTWSPVGFRLLLLLWVGL